MLGQFACRDSYYIHTCRVCCGSIFFICCCLLLLLCFGGQDGRNACACVCASVVTMQHNKFCEEEESSSARGVDTDAAHKESGKEEEMQRGDGGERGGDAAEYTQELLCKEYITDMTFDVFRSGFFCQVAGNNVTQFFAAAPSSTLLLVVQVVQSVSLLGITSWLLRCAARAPSLLPFSVCTGYKSVVYSLQSAGEILCSCIGMNGVLGVVVDVLAL